jgi:hypothetical protein
MGFALSAPPFTLPSASIASLRVCHFRPPYPSGVLWEYTDPHCNENPIYVFLFWELRVLSPNFHIHVSVSDLYIPRIGPHIFLQQNRQIDQGNI